MKDVADSSQSTGEVWTGGLEDLPTLRVREHVVAVKTTEREGAICERGQEKRDELEEREVFGRK